jgi:hypothetical protein
MRFQRKAGFGLFRFRSPLLTESRLLSLPPGTEMVHFPGFARTRLWIQRAVSRFYREGFPHSEIPGSKGASPSPRLIAGSHVLHRRLAPRHPPYALSSLTIKSAQHTKRSTQPSAISLQLEAPSSSSCGLTAEGRLLALAPQICLSSARILPRADCRRQSRHSTPNQVVFTPWLKAEC